MIALSRVTALSLVIAAGTLTACRNRPPDQDQITVTYNGLVQRVRDTLALALAACESHADPAGCKSRAVEEHNRQLAGLVEAERLAQERRWNEAYETKRRHEETVKELAPKVVDILTPLSQDSTLDVDMTLTPGVPVVISGQLLPGERSYVPASTPVRALQPIRIDPYRVSGTFAVDGTSFTLPATISGDLQMSHRTQSGLALVAYIRSGELRLHVPFQDPLGVVVQPDAANAVRTQADGNGWIEIFVELTEAPIEWLAVVPSYQFWRLPVSSDSYGNISIDTGIVPSGQFVPYYVSALSDYNADGTLDHPSDLAAFIADWNLQDLSTDYDLNGVWNQIDIDLWTARFLEDHANAPAQ